MSLGPIERISPGQFFWMVGVSVVAGGVYIWPETILRATGFDAVWALSTASLLAIGIVALDMAWARRVPGLTHLDRLRRLWGPLAWFWFGGFLVFMVVVDAALAALFSDLLQVFFYPNTPIWSLVVLLVGLGAWFGGQSLTVLARNTQFWFPLVLASFFALAVIAMPQAHDTGALRPNWPPSLSDLWAGVPATWYLWAEGPVATTLVPWVRSAHWRSVQRWALSAMLFQAVMLLIIGALVVATLGPWAAQVLQWPLIYVFANLGPVAFFIARPGIFLLSTWAAALVFYLGVRIFAVSINLEAGFRLDSAVRPWIAWGLGIVIVVLALCFPNPASISRLLVDTLDPLAFLWMGFHSALAFGLSYLRGFRKPLPSGLGSGPVPVGLEPNPSEPGGGPPG
jgi:hypothetical protein